MTEPTTHGHLCKIQLTVHMIRLQCISTMILCSFFLSSEGHEKVFAELIQIYTLWDIYTKVVPFKIMNPINMPFKFKVRFRDYVCVSINNISFYVEGVSRDNFYCSIDVVSFRSWNLSGFNYVHFMWIDIRLTPMSS